MEKLKTKEKHGMTKTPIYRVWADMKNRCYNENIKHYGIYGGRGISVCNAFYTKEEAHEAYLKMKLEWYGY